MRKFVELFGTQDLSDVTVIGMPRRIDFEGAVAFTNQLNTIQNAKVYIFDFKRTTFVKPFAMLLVASAIEQFTAKYPDAIFAAHNFQHSELTYAAHMGFFKHIGLTYGKDPGQADGNSSYQAITVLSVSEIRQRANQGWVDIGDIVEADAQKLATILSRQQRGAIFETLTFSIREIIRNVVEHSNSPTVRYCAQYWPGLNEVEIAVLDTGIGLRRTLESNPNLTMTEDADAVKLAVLPGVSGVAWKGNRVQDRGDWTNSGYGLFMTSQLCNEIGSFFICSGTAGLKIESGQKISVTTDLQGTAVMLKLRTDKMTDANKTLARLSKEGREIAKKIASAQELGPSSASTMLSIYFGSKGRR